jgi:uncharacterized protein YdaU (DUF1376 family)
MTDEQVGLYTKLLCHQWNDGPLPIDTEEMAAQCGVNAMALASAWHRLSECFEVRDGGYVSPFLEDVRVEQLARVERLSAAGKLGAEKRWGSHGNPNGIREENSRKEEIREDERR